jgi:hypothetical protein
VILLIQETLKGRQNSFKEQTEFTILTKLLEPLVSNMKDSIKKLKFFSHSLLTVILHKNDVPHRWKH